MKIGILANKGKSNDFNFYNLNIISWNVAKQKKSCFPQIKSYQVIISCFQEEHKCYYKCAFNREIKAVNQSLKMINKWNSSAKEGTFTQIS